MRAVKYFLGIALIIVIGIVSYRVWHDRQMRKPVLNQNPTHFIELYGKVPPTLDVKFSAYYFSNNKACEETINGLEGATSPLIKEFIYEPLLQNGDNYKIKIPLDYLNSGYCDWKITSIVYFVNEHQRVDKKDYNILISFSNENTVDLALNQKNLDISCNLDKTDDLMCKPVFTNFDFQNDSLTHLQLNINFTQGKNHA